MRSIVAILLALQLCVLAKSDDFSEELFGVRHSSVSEFFKPSSSKLELATDNISGTILRRSFSQERAMGVDFGFGLLSKENTEISLSPFDGTSLSFSTSKESLSRLNETVLNSREIQTIGLKQTFGSDGILSFNQTTTNTTNAEQKSREETVQALGLRATINPGWTTAVNFTAKNSSDEAGPKGSDWNAQLNMALSGGSGLFALSHSEYAQAGHRTNGDLSEILLPLRFLGSTLTLGRRESRTTVDGAVIARDNAETFLFPFKIDGKDATLSYLTSDKISSGVALQTRKMDVVLPLRMAGRDFSLQHHVDDETKNGVAKKSDITSFVMQLGGPGRIAYVMSDSLLNGTRQNSNQLSVVFPLKIGKDIFLLEGVDTDGEINGAQSDSLMAKISGPIPFLHGWKADYTKLEQQLSGTEINTTTLHFLAPIEVLGAKIVSELTRTEQETPSSNQSQQTISVIAPVLGDSLNLQQQTTTTQTGDLPATDQIVTRVISPKMTLLNDLVELNARMMKTESSSATPQLITGVDVTLKPSNAISLSGTIEQRDTGPATSGATTTLTGNYKMSEQTSLGLKITESDISDRRMIFAVVTKSLKINAGLISWDKNGETSLAPRASFSVGKSDKLNLMAEYKGVDFDKNGAIAPMSVPLVNLALSAGDPKKLAVQLKSIQTPGRIGIERGVALQFPALGGRLKIGYGENLADPRDPRLVRLATVYDAGFESKILGDITLVLAFRNLCLETGRSELFQNIQISGGDASQGGEIRISAMSGDFVAPNQQGLVLPDSTLDISYRRNLKNGATISLIMKEIDKSTQALFEYKTTF